MAGTLYIVSTPIGNLEDISLRALRIMREVYLIACEDTRHTRKLLNHFHIPTRTISYHEHNERERAEYLGELLESGKNIALVSDAGTPLFSDPGFRIVNFALGKGLPVVPVPGATALITALTASGMAPDQFFFAGFLPSRAGARRSKLEELSVIPATLVFYEAPHRIAAMLRDACDVLGDRDATIARELTKLHEEFVRGKLSDLAQRFKEPSAARGELVLMIGAAHPNSADDEQIRNTPAAKLAERMRELESDGIDAKTALKKAARELGLKRDDAYRLWETQKKRRRK